MSEAKHTTGPWQIMNAYDGATVVIANADGETFSDGTSTFSYDFVCDTLRDDSDGIRSREIAVANARLIAAAPDMLEALKDVRKSFVWQTLNADTRMRVKLAISKAKGINPDE